MPRKPIDKLDKNAPLTFLEMVKASAEFKAEKKALFNLDRRKRLIQQGRGWDEDTEKILVGNRDEMALQRQALAQDVWRLAVIGDYEGLAKKIEEDQEGVGMKRGIFGESLLHVCLLFGANSEQHSKIARMLVMKYGEVLVNGQYNRNPYYGEAPLHMSIINKDVSFSLFLIQNNANIHAQAKGSFFRPSGKVYYGDYPLSFAACVNNFEIVKILLDAGADVTAQDTCLGNTVLHMMVIHNRKKMYDFIIDYVAQMKTQAKVVQGKEYNFEAKKKKKDDGEAKKEGEEGKEGGTEEKTIPIDRIQNGFQRTPFTLAVELGKLEMFDHLVNKKKELLWSYGNVRAVAYPLDEMDSFPDPSRQSKSALEIIVNRTEYQDYFGYEVNRSLELLDRTPITQLLQEKWQKFAKFWFYTWVFSYLLFLVVFNLSVLTPRGSGVRAITEIIILICAGAIVIFELGDFYTLGRNYLLDRGSRLFYAVIWMFSICIFLAWILRAALVDSVKAENILFSIASVCAWTFLFFFARGFQTLGYMTVMIREMVFTDIFRFLIVYVVFLFGFSVGFTILFEDIETINYQNLGFSMFSLYQNFLADFPNLEEYQDAISKGMVHSLHIAYTATVTILMVNLLIAMLNDTFQKVQDKARLQWKLEWASIILMIERRLPPALRKRHRSGKPGRDLGFDNDTYYIILEERIAQSECDIVRPGQKRLPKLNVFVRDVMKELRAQNPKEASLERTWQWPSIKITPKSDGNVEMQPISKGKEPEETPSNDQ